MTLRVELAEGWHLLRVQVGAHHEWIIVDPDGDRLGNTSKHLGEFDEAMLRVHGEAASK